MDDNHVERQSRKKNLSKKIIIKEIVININRYNKH